MVVVVEEEELMMGVAGLAGCPEPVQAQMDVYH